MTVSKTISNTVSKIKPSVSDEISNENESLTRYGSNNLDASMRLLEDLFDCSLSTAIRSSKTNKSTTSPLKNEIKKNGKADTFPVNSQFSRSKKVKLKLPILNVCIEKLKTLVFRLVEGLFFQKRNVAISFLHGIIILFFGYIVLAQESTPLVNVVLKIGQYVEQEWQYVGEEGLVNPTPNKVTNSKTDDSIDDTLLNHDQSSGIDFNRLINGIDVSHYQNNVDWIEIKKDGVSFAYIKATEGISYVDPKFVDNVMGAKNANVLHGGYHFYVPADNAKKQADHFLQQLKYIHNSLPPVLDIELTQGVDTSIIINGLKEWLSIVEQETGCRPIIYTYYSYWESYLKNEFPQYDLWLADYASQEKLASLNAPWLFLQYTDKGKVSGINGNVDGCGSFLTTLF